MRNKMKNNKILNDKNLFSDFINLDKDDFFKVHSEISSES